MRNNAGLPLTYPRSLFLLSKLAARIKPWIARQDVYRSHPRTNYMNFTEALRHKTRFQDLVYAMLQDLIRGGIFPRGEIEQWWEEHIKRKADHTALLLNLASLEILRKSESI